MNCTCPSCQMENAYFDIMDSNGANYTCPDCDFEWCDSEISLEDEDDLKIYLKCPKCSIDGNRWIYKCNECDMVGCYDEFNYNGCYSDINKLVNCPNCGICSYEIIGQVGNGSDD